MQNSLTPQDRFDYAVSFVLKHEGGYINNKNDPGGATNFGVSLRFLKTNHIDLNHDELIDVNDVKSMTVEQSKEIYKKYFWEKNHYETINNLKIGSKIFDMSVNMGAKQANKIAQISVNRLIEKPITVDGILGKQSFSMINRLCEENKGDDLYNELKDNQAHFYINLVADKPELKQFLLGWLKRAEE